MDTYEKAKKIAAAYVAARMYTCKEIEDRLKRKGIDSDTAERVVSDFAMAGILNDRQYAKSYTKEAITLSCKGIFRVKQELYAKGIAKSIIDEATTGFEEESYNALCEFVEMRNLCERITSRKDLEKLKAKLARRGFSLSEIRECLSNYQFNLEE